MKKFKFILMALFLTMASSSLFAQGQRALRPSITSVAPTSGAVGTTVLVNGFNFIGTNSVKLKNTNVTYVVITDSLISFVVPPGATSGNISVQNQYGKDSWSRFIVTPPTPQPPTITSFSPTSDSVGNVVTIIGTNLDIVTSVTLNGQTVSFSIIDSVTIEFRVPVGATSGPISVTNSYGTATSSNNFTVLLPYVPQPPVITSFSPTSGYVGTTVTVTGNNFSTATSLTINGLGATFNIINNTTITFVVPSGATSGIIEITNPDGASISSTSFTVIVPVPTITSFSPTSGYVGSTITVNGTNFTGATSVTLNGLSTTFTIVNTTTITFTVPNGATSGQIEITTPYGVAGSLLNYTVLIPQPPTITSISPTSGPVGTTITVNGTNFGTATSVKLNGLSVTFSIVSGTQITFVVPSGATSGAISVTNPDGTATGPSFTVTASAPTITSISPTSGPIGTVVTITGTNLSGATSVTLNGASVTFNVISSSSITFTVPSGATSGLVSVTTSGGTVNGPTYTVTTVQLPVVTRGAYMVCPNSTSITIQWRTDISCNSEVRYGTSATSLTSSTSSSTNVTDHTIKLSGLTPNTLYYYSVGIIGTTLQSGTGNKFLTAPIDNSTVNFWVTGDFGNNSTNQRNVLNSFLNYTADWTINGWIWLGDNAYSNGTDAEYQSNVFNIYGNLFQRLPIFPELGNHDYGQAGYQSSSSLGTSAPYFNIFAIPTNSGTEKYYSMNYGNVHLIGLDSYGSYNSSSSAMYSWLQNDLASNTLPWVVVYWHHAPYTKGSHNSDTEVELIDMRTNINPLLEQYGVDAVLSGHSHIYERSKFIKDHFGLSTTFNNSIWPSGNVVQSSSNSYTKTSLRGNGTVYTVCGVSGQAGGATSSGYPHPAMQVSTTSNNGSLLLSANNTLLTCRFINTSGAIFDSFSITKTVARLSGSENNNRPEITDEAYYNLNGEYLGNKYDLIPKNQIVIYRYKKDGEMQFRKVTFIE